MPASTFHQQQTRKRTGFALRASLPAVVHDNARDWTASRRAGLLSVYVCYPQLDLALASAGALFTRIFSLVPGILPRSSQMRARRSSLGRARSFSLRGLDCNPTVRNALSHKRFVKLIAGARHFFNLPISSSQSTFNVFGVPVNDVPNFR